MDDDANESDDDNGHHDASDMYCWPFTSCAFCHVTHTVHTHTHTQTDTQTVLVDESFPEGILPSPKWINFLKSSREGGREGGSFPIQKGESTLT